MADQERDNRVYGSELKQRERISVIFRGQEFVVTIESPNASSKKLSAQSRLGLRGLVVGQQGDEVVYSRSELPSDEYGNFRYQREFANPVCASLRADGASLGDVFREVYGEVKSRKDGLPDDQKIAWSIDFTLGLKKHADSIPRALSQQEQLPQAS